MTQKYNHDWTRQAAQYFRDHGDTHGKPWWERVNDDEKDAAKKWATEAGKNFIFLPKKIRHEQNL